MFCGFRGGTPKEPGQKCQGLSLALGCLANNSRRIPQQKSVRGSCRSKTSLSPLLLKHFPDKLVVLLDALTSMLGSLHGRMSSLGNFQEACVNDKEQSLPPS